MLCVRGGGSIIPFEEDSLPQLIYLLLLSDSLIQPQNQSPEEAGRAHPSNPSVPVRFCSVELSLKITTSGGRQGGGTLKPLWDLGRTQQPGADLSGAWSERLFSTEKAWVEV